VRSYSKKNNIDVNILLKENYDHYCPLELKLCKYCNSECPYDGYIKGYKNPCFSPECYKKFVSDNNEYYSRQINLEYYDLYDSRQYECAFSKRYYDITEEQITTNKRFFINKNCVICNSVIKDISLFSREINNQTCSDECKHKRISLSTRNNCLYNLEDRIFKSDVEVNHYIFKNRKYPLNDKHGMNTTLIKKYKNRPELQIPPKNSTVYFSKKYNMYFFNIKGSKVKSTLYRYLGSDQEYLNYHIENNLGKTECPGCKKKMLFQDVFGKNYFAREYCSASCYWESLVGKVAPEDLRIKHSNSMKELISKGKFTPNITNSWARSKTKVIINGEEKFVRSSWEAVFWALNQDFMYETVRVKYIDTNQKERNYIVDFYSKENNCLYEIKPKSEIGKPNNILKEKYALKYCKKNNMNYLIIDEDYFIERINEITFDNLKDFISEETLLKFKKGIKPLLKLAHPMTQEPN
jgi:hypothetical protein